MIMIIRIIMIGIMRVIVIAIVIVRVMGIRNIIKIITAKPNHLK
jgi:hypothetical protein